MPKFCIQCGTPAANDLVKFCSKCGAAMPASAPAQAAAPPPATAPAPPAVATVAANSSSGWIKVLVGILGFFVVVGALGVGTCVYVGYKAKQKFEQAKTEYGMGNTGPAAQERDVCSLISKEEVAQFAGVPVTRAEGSTTRCTYSSETTPVVLETDVGWEGAKLGLKLGVMALKNMAGPNTIIQVPGIGDEAYTIGLDAKTAADMQKQAESDQSGMVKGMTHLLAEAPVMFRKGDVMVTVRLMQATDPDTAKKSIAKAIASRL
jgi:hypothetical protein